MRKPIVKPRLNEILSERGLTQLKLSEMCGVPQPSISRFDKSEKHLDWHMFAIASALELNISDLFTVTWG